LPRFWQFFDRGGHSPILATVLVKPLGAEHFIFCLVIGPHSGRYQNFDINKVSHFRFFGLHSLSFVPVCAIVFHISPRHKLKPQLSEKYLSQCTSLTLLEIWPIKKKFKIPITRKPCMHYPNYFVPLHVAHWALPHSQQKPGFGDHIWGPGPPESEFRIFDLAATSCTLAYIFVHTDKRVSWHTMHKMLGRSTLKQPPKIWGFKIFGDVALFEFATFGG